MLMSLSQRDSPGCERRRSPRSREHRRSPRESRNRRGSRGSPQDPEEWNPKDRHHRRSNPSDSAVRGSHHRRSEERSSAPRRSNPRASIAPHRNRVADLSQEPKKSIASGASNGFERVRRFSQAIIHGFRKYETMGNAESVAPDMGILRETGKLRSSKRNTN